MRVFALFMILLIVVAFAAFISLNHGLRVETISVGYKFFSDVSLNMVIAWAFALGIIWALIIFITQEMRLRIRIASLKSSISRLQNELDHLRTMPLEEIGIVDKEEK